MAGGKNTDTVLALMSAINRNDKDAILDFFRHDSVFHNIPMEPAVGREAIWEILAIVHGPCTEVDWILHSICESGDGTVLTERTDRYRIDGQWISYQVMGAFNLDGRIITSWRDYFDLNQSVNQDFKYDRPKASVPV